MGFIYEIFSKSKSNIRNTVRQSITYSSDQRSKKQKSVFYGDHNNRLNTMILNVYCAKNRILSGIAILLKNNSSSNTRHKLQALLKLPK